MSKISIHLSNCFTSSAIFSTHSGSFPTSKKCMVYAVYFSWRSVKHLMLSAGAIVLLRFLVIHCFHDLLKYTGVILFLFSVLLFFHFFSPLKRISLATGIILWFRVGRLLSIGNKVLTFRFRMYGLGYWQILLGLPWKPTLTLTLDHLTWLMYSSSIMGSGTWCIITALWC